MAVSLPSARVGGRVCAIAGVVDVWRVDLDGAPEGLQELLSPEERARGARIVHERKRVRWARSRGMLRLLLGRYLDADPRELRFASGPHGKPRLLGEPWETPRDSGSGPREDLRFNLSHSGELLLVAVSAGREVGVDVEVAPDPARGPVDEPAIATRRLAALDAEERTTAFLRAWTMHEAIVKCLGTGLAGAPAAGDEDAGAGLWRAVLDVGPGAAAALAVELTLPPASAPR